MTTDPPRGSTGARRPRRRRSRAATTGALLVLVPLAAVGVVVDPGVSLAIGAIFAACAWAFVWAMHRDPGGDAWPPAHPATFAAWAALLPPALAGGAVVGAVAVVLAAVALAVAALSAAGSSLFHRPEAALAGHAGESAPADVASLPELLRSLPIDVLCLEWRCTSEGEPFPDGNTVGREQVRVLLLGELRRRDLPGTLRWLSEAPGSPPDQYVRDLRDRAA